MKKTTNLFEKLLPSIINLGIILSITYLIYVIFSQNFKINFQVIFVLITLLYNLNIAFFNKNRCLGMIIMNTHWEEDYPLKQTLIYALLYSLSFFSVVIHILFPFDLLLLNLLLLQLPFVLTKQTTLHGYLSGNMRTAIDKD